MTKLRGVAWDHPRATVPLAAGGDAWAASTGHQIEWSARSLKQFEDQGLEELVKQFDVVLIDYPFAGTGASNRLLLAVESWVGSDELEAHRRSSAGPSFESYAWADQHWALPIDAACQVSAARSDLLMNLDVERPDSWHDVLLTARDLATSRHRVALPLTDNHAYCCFVSLGISLGGPNFWPHGSEWDRDIAHWTLEVLRDLVPFLHPDSLECDPIQVSDRMSMTDDIAYVPLMFGYSTYSRSSTPAPLDFFDAPVGPAGVRGSVLGGVGAAVSAYSEHSNVAASLARFLCGGEYQAGDYATNMGQPAHGDAWQAELPNRLTRDFFSRTSRTLETAFVRPKSSGHRMFQPEAGSVILDVLKQKCDVSAGVDQLSALHAVHLGSNVSDRIHG